MLPAVASARLVRASIGANFREYGASWIGEESRAPETYSVKKMAPHILMRHPALTRFAARVAGRFAFGATPKRKRRSA